jgi:hypothetical protein
MRGDELKEVSKGVLNKRGKEGTDTQGICDCVFNNITLVVCKRERDKHTKVFRLLKAVTFGERTGSKEDNEEKNGRFHFCSDEYDKDGDNGEG